MKELMEYMDRHYDDLIETITDDQQEISKKFENYWG